MRAWIGRQLQTVLDTPEPVRILLDPNCLLDAAELEILATDSVPVVAEDWLGLRRPYEEFGRSRRPDDIPFVIIVRSQSMREPRDLPWDIEQAAHVSRLRFPGPGLLREAILDLPRDMQDRALEATRGHDPLDGLLVSLWGVGLSTAPPDSVELEVVLRLRLDATVPPSVWPLLRERLTSPLALALVETPVDTEPLQVAWADWIGKGESSEWNSVFLQIGPRIAPMFHSGLLDPVPTSREVPAWAAPGVRQAGPIEKVRALLGAAPSAELPQTLTEWIELAAWWGDVRLALSLASPEADDLAAEAWKRWETWDCAFRDFLHTQYASLLTSVAPHPQVLHRIAPFLSRRLRNDDAHRIMLVVFDGMGFPQWSQMRDAAGLHVHEAWGVLAMAPTLTPVSRKAIFAGQLPNTFGDALMDIRSQSAHEERMWRSHWTSEGVSVTDIGYKNIEGTRADEVPDFPGKRAVGVVVRAIDELMHTSEMLGEAQFTSNVATWLDHGFVEMLVSRSCEAGFEVWFTADHGNLPVVPQGRPPAPGSGSIPPRRFAISRRRTVTRGTRQACRLRGHLRSSRGVGSDCAMMSA
jgi:hypothetical protein